MSRWVRFLLAISVAVTSVTLAGCWDLMELNKASLITGIAIEPGHKGKLKATVEIMNASEAQAHQPGKGVAPSIVQAMEGNTLAEILFRLNEKLDRQLVISHARIIVFDERLARLGISQYMDSIQRSRYVREDVLILICQAAHASGVMKILFPRGSYSSLKIQSQIESYRDAWGGVPASRLFDFNQGLLAEGRELIMGAVTIKGKADKGMDTKSIQTVTPKSLVEISGTAVFRGDVLLGFLNTDESRMVMMASNQLKATTVSVPLEDKEKYAAIRLLRTRAHMQVSMIKGTPRIKLSINGEGIIGGVDMAEHLTEVSGYQHLEELTESYVKQQMTAVIQNVQHKFGVDIFGFGEQLYRWHFKQFKPVAADWNELFAKAPVTVKVKIALRRAELKTDHIKKEELGP
ncbi:Ger(x)C family spore germination protein [Paenibacillus solisilvae]|uniref:Ger(X)C family spore germination protein n=1 Tax=Paenibacillus solisilvae TaxID=2486751 RepID=A0ABW0W8L6_9BACL